MSDNSANSESNGQLVPAGPRQADGRFAPGNKFARGNPMTLKVHKLRTCLLNAVDEGELLKVVKKLISKAKAGDMVAIKELLDRVLGRPTQSVELTAIEAKQVIKDMSDEELFSIARTGTGGN